MSERETVSPVMAVEAIFVMFLVARFLVSTVQVPRLPERVIVGVVSVESNDLFADISAPEMVDDKRPGRTNRYWLRSQSLICEVYLSYPWDLHSSVLVKLRQY